MAKLIFSSSVWEQDERIGIWTDEKNGVETKAQLKWENKELVQLTTPVMLESIWEQMARDEKELNSKERRENFGAARRCLIFIIWN